MFITSDQACRSNIWPIYLSKVDLADGFYCFRLNLSAIPKLAVAFPHYKGEEQLIAFPLVEPMGWMESPPTFCTGTETVADIANSIPPHVRMPPHPLEMLALTPPEEPPPLTLHNTNNLSPPTALQLFQWHACHNDVYVDNFISTIQGTKHQRLHHL